MNNAPTPPRSPPPPAAAGEAPLPIGNAIHAGFWRRHAAWMADALVFSPWVVAAFALVEQGVYATALFLSLPPLGWLYESLLHSSPWQATLGKRAMGIKVVDAQGRRIGFGRATGRWFGKVVSCVIPFYIGFLLAAFTPRKQAFHDYAASTCVVFNAVQPGAALPTKRPRMPWYGWALNFLPLVLLVVVPAVILLGGYVYGTGSSRFIADAVLPAAKPLQAEIDSQGCRQGKRPSPHPWIETVEVMEVRGDCLIVLVFGGSPDVPGPVNHNGLRLTRGQDGRWSCSTTVPGIYRPDACPPSPPPGEGRLAPRPPPPRPKSLDGGASR